MGALRHGIVKKEQSTEIVFDYSPKDFQAQVTTAANDFVSGQNYPKTDFKISNLVADQTGITELQRKTLEDKIEAVALERLKDIEEKAYKEAYDLGLLEGAEKAFNDSKADLIERIQSIDNVLQSCEHVKKQLMAENEGQLIKLVYEIAKRIAMVEIKENKEAIVSIITQLLESIQIEEKILVKVSPDDFNFLEGIRNKSEKSAELLKRVKLESYDQIQSGGCQIETNYGSINATIDGRAERAWEILESKVPHVRDSGESVD